MNDGPNTLTVKKGDPIVLDIGKASRDPIKFPDPEEIRLDRLDENYMVFGHGMHKCLGRHIAVVGLVEQLKLLGQLKGFRRAKGAQGILRTRKVGAEVRFLSEAADTWNALPTSKLSQILPKLLNLCSRAYQIQV